MSLPPPQQKLQKPKTNKQQQQLLSPALQNLLTRLDTNLGTGLSSAQVSQRRLQGSNTVDPPIKCPAWICCLLPCLKSLPSRKAFAAIQPDDALVKRGKRWMRYDASSLVVGDVIRVQEGDVIPADAVVVKVLLLSSSEENVVMEDESNDNVGILQEVSSTTDLLVDHSKVTGERILQRISRSSLAAPDNDQSVSVVQLYWGGRVVQGSALAVVTATGSNTLVAQLIRDGKFPVRIKPDADVDDDSKAAALEDNVEEGVSLMTRRDSRLS